MLEFCFKMFSIKMNYNSISGHTELDPGGATGSGQRSVSEALGSEGTD